MQGRDTVTIQREKQRERREMILGVLLAVGVITTAVVAPNAVQLFKYFIPRNAKERGNIMQSFNRLEKRGLVKKAKKQGGNYYSLTAVGRKRALQYQANVTKIIPSKKWDGTWNLIMFDIPEDKKQARRAVNLALRKLGCAQYQKSVFITPYPCKKEVDFVGEAFDVRKYIRVITACEVEGVENIKKAFKL